MDLPFINIKLICIRVIWFVMEAFGIYGWGWNCDWNESKKRRWALVSSQSTLLESIQLAQGIVFTHSHDFVPTQQSNWNTTLKIKQPNNNLKIHISSELTANCNWYFKYYEEKMQKRAGFCFVWLMSLLRFREHLFCSCGFDLLENLEQDASYINMMSWIHWDPENKDIWCL